MLDTTHQTKAQRVLDALNQGLERADFQGVADLFQDDCYWRDLVSLTWNIKTMEGKPQILDMLGSQAGNIQPTRFLKQRWGVVTD